MELKQKITRITLTLAIAATLSACGGGNTDTTVATDPTARALMTIDANNADATSGAAYSGLANQQNSGSLNLTSGTNTGNGNNASITVGKIAQNYLALNNNGQSSQVNGAVSMGTTKCSHGGSMTTTSSSMVYSNCRVNYPDGSYDITNGSVSISNLMQSGTSASCDQSMSGTFSFNNMMEVEYNNKDEITNSTSLNGGITFSRSQAMVNLVCKTTNSISGKYLALKSNNNSDSFFNFMMGGTTDVSLNYSLYYNVTMDVSSLSGSMKVETINPIVGVGSNTYPTSGEIQITANSTTAGVPAIINIKIVGGGVILDVDVDGIAGSDIGYPNTMSWAEFTGL